jgi:hypothetical protein
VAAQDKIRILYGKQNLKIGKPYWYFLVPLMGQKGLPDAELSC